MSETKSINKVDLFGNEVNVAFNLIWPVGVTYPQYPGQKSPMDLWGEFSTWEKIDYEGAFFRAAGGNANPWIEVTTTDGQNFTVTSSDVSSAVLKQNAKVKFNGETRTVSSTGSGSSVPSFTVSSAFTEPDGGYQNITNVYILQAEQTRLMKHKHTVNVTTSAHTHGLLVQTTNNFGNASAIGAYFGNLTEGIAGTDGVGGAYGISGTTSHQKKDNKDRAFLSSETQSVKIKTNGMDNSTDYAEIDQETRPVNATLTVWRRTA